SWVPDPGDYRKSLWQQVGKPDGPATWDDLLSAGSQIKGKTGVRVGIGMSPEIDSNMAARALIWSYGGGEQDANENVTLNSPATALAAQHVMYNWIAPKFAKNPDAAKEFLIHYTANFDQAAYNSHLYDFPAFKERVPQLDSWLATDPFGSNPANKLGLLKFDDAVTWTTNIGHPGPANTAIGEVFNTFVLPNMMASAARGAKT